MRSLTIDEFGPHPMVLYSDKNESMILESKILNKLYLNLYH